MHEVAAWNKQPSILGRDGTNLPADTQHNATWEGPAGGPRCRLSSQQVWREFLASVDSWPGRAPRGCRRGAAICSRQPARSTSWFPALRSPLPEVSFRVTHTWMPLSPAPFLTRFPAQLAPGTCQGVLASSPPVGILSGAVEDLN